MSKPTKQIIVIAETVLESWMRDASTFALFAALIGIGWLLDSGAMQWVGAIIGFITVISYKTPWKKPLTIAEARLRLDEIEREIAA